MCPGHSAPGVGLDSNDSSSRSGEHFASKVASCIGLDYNSSCSGLGVAVMSSEASGVSLDADCCSLHCGVAPLSQAPPSMSLEGEDGTAGECELLSSQVPLNGRLQDHSSLMGLLELGISSAT